MKTKWLISGPNATLTVKLDRNWDEFTVLNNLIGELCKLTDDDESEYTINRLDKVKTCSFDIKFK